MMVTIPDDQRQEVVAMLHNWSSSATRYSFTLKEAAECLGQLVHICRVCPWGKFLFQNLHHEMVHALQRNAHRIQHDPKFRDILVQRDYYHSHPTDSSKYRFFCKKVARAIFDSKAKTYLTSYIHQEVDFLLTILSNPGTYHWGSLIPHLIP
jgi:hypothetical protein